MRGWVLLGAFALASGCSSTSAFSCMDDGECNLGGNAGYCVSPGFCAFDDPACPSGRRYGSYAGIGLADECVPGDAGSSGGSTAAGSEMTSLASSSAEDASTAMASASESSTSGSNPPQICTTYSFDEDPMFEDLGVYIQVYTDAGRLLGVWDETARGTSAQLGVDAGVDVSTGSCELELADFPGAQGTMVSVSWVDAAGRVLGASVDGPEFVITFEDPDQPETLFLATEDHGGRNLLRIRSEDGALRVEAGDASGYGLLTTVEQPFDATSVDVVLFFNRYDSSNDATSVALESLTSCTLE